MQKQSFQDQLKAAVPMRCKNLEKMSQKADVSGQAGAVTRGASCLASTTQRSGYKDIALTSAKARLSTFLSGYHPSEPREFPAAHGTHSLSDSPVGVKQISCALTLPCKTDESTAVTDSVTSTIEKTTLAETLSVCVAGGGSLPPPGYSQPGYLQYVTGYYHNTCPYGMWVGGPFHVSAGGGCTSPCKCGTCGPCGPCKCGPCVPCSPCGYCGAYFPCGPCAPCGPYVPNSPCYSCCPSTVCGSCYCPFVPNYCPNTQYWSNFSEPLAQGTPETIDVPEVPDIPETPPMSSYDSRLTPKTTVGADLMPCRSNHGTVPGVVSFAPEPSDERKSNKISTILKPPFDNPLPSKNRNRPILNRPTKLP